MIYHYQRDIVIAQLSLIKLFFNSLHIVNLGIWNCKKRSKCLCSIKYLRRCMLQFLNGSWTVIEYFLVSLCATIWQMDLMFCSCSIPEYIFCVFIIYYFTKRGNTELDIKFSYFIETLCMSQYQYLYNAFYYRDINLTCIVWMINNMHVGVLICIVLYAHMLTLVYTESLYFGGCKKRNWQEVCSAFKAEWHDELPRPICYAGYIAFYSTYFSIESMSCGCQ